MTILLVDDELDEYVLCRDLLVRAGAPGYNLRWARSFEAGLDMLEQDRPTVCLVDYQLGVRSGLDFVRLARSKGATADIPLIVMTGHGDRSIDAEAIEAGAADYVDKLHLTPAVLERSIRHAVERAGAAREARAHERAAALGERVDALDRLAGHVAHDFNNLITVMRGCIDLLEMDATDGAERTWNLETLRSTADRASDLTRNLLDLRGRSRIEAIDLDVGPFVAGMRGAIEHLIGDNVTLVIDALDQPATVRIDGARLELAVLNLAANARDAMQGGGRLTISLEIAQTSAASGADQLDENGGVLLSVSDTGHGMDAATVAHVFEPYFSTKARGRGTGLGLAAVHGTVVDAGGAIAIESALGAGTTVRIWLPRVARPHLELVTS